ncbi:sialate O-acetylesterase [soil metagenome]
MDIPPSAFRVAAVLSVILSVATCAEADIALPSIFGAHAVLQKSPRTGIWGKADPGEAVKITLGPATAQATTGADGRWKTTLDLSQSAQGPFELVVEGKNRLSVPDVVVGEVWLCSGQSNMQYTLRGDLHAAAELKLTNPLLRQFQVAIANSAEPQEDCAGAWGTATPETAGAFTAVGYYFGKKLQTELKVPVGLIHSSVPGSPIEIWMSAEGFARLPALNTARLARLKTYQDYPEKLRKYVASYQDWANKNAREDKPTDPAGFAETAVSTEDWTPVTIPGKMAAASLPASGSIWLRRTVNVPKVAAGKPGTITMGLVHDFLTISWNGMKVASTDPGHPPTSGIYKFPLPGENIKEGDNTLALRVFSASDQAGIDPGFSPNVAIGLNGVGQPVILSGPWLAKVENALPLLSKEALAAMPRAPGVPSPSVPSFAYNAMIAPLVPYSLRGIIWYQGEANVGRAAEYRTLFPAFIEDYRAHWGEALPFYFCQLPNYLPGAKEPGKGTWPELREAQAGALALPKTGEAVLIDVGEESNLHPRNKKDPGERLARLALANEYGEKIAAVGPTFESMKIEEDKIRVKFQNIEGGLVAKPLPTEYKPNSVQPQMKPLLRKSPKGDLEGFAICGEDHKWAWADAKIDGDSVVLSAAGVPKPIAVRYAWEDSPIVNLYNTAELPAPPFRTDKFPGLTDGAKY